MAVTSTAFGLDVHSELPLSLLDGSAAHRTERTLAISLQSGARRWWPESAERLSDEYQPDGSLVYEIQAHPGAGYLIAGPHYGAHLLSADGRLLVCDPEGLPDAGWQRLLIAQVLPFAALLQGLEVFHASAVVWQGRAVGLLGRSGAGKTSLALELCRRGADFLADDVLALECREDRLLAHPGTPVAGIARAGEWCARETQALPYGEIVAVNERERLVRVAGAREPVALAALLLLDRRADGPDCPRFEPAADAQMLLSATFNFVLATPARLRGLLDVCALAARVRVERVVCGPTTDLSRLGAAVALRLGAAP
jgi:hypothetical protein